MLLPEPIRREMLDYTNWFISKLMEGVLKELLASGYYD